MLIVVIPVLVMSVGIPWRYRASNTKAKYDPEWRHSNLIEAVIWIGPALIVAALGVLVWTSTHRLDPYKALSSERPPVEVEAVSLDWKWLFIYPELGIATVNQLVFPVNTPLSLRITSDTVMTAFFIPQLGSQIYSMAGMETRLNLMADEPGNYWGDNSQYSGNGFHDMHFEAKATTPEAFGQWVDQVKQSSLQLDDAELAKLEKPSAGWVPVAHFSAVKPKLFDSIMGKYMSMAGMSSMSMPDGQTMQMPDGRIMKMSDMPAMHRPVAASSPADADAGGPSPDAPHSAARQQPEPEVN
jgi:cytochrome o ubiquinol oxidase subunit 2